MFRKAASQKRTCLLRSFARSSRIDDSLIRLYSQVAPLLSVHLFLFVKLEYIGAKGAAHLHCLDLCWKTLSHLSAFPLWDSSMRNAGRLREGSVRLHSMCSRPVTLEHTHFTKFLGKFILFLEESMLSD